MSAGIHFLVPLGSTGETPCLDDEEKVRILDLTKEHAEGLTVLAGVGTNSLKQTVRNMRLLDNADMFLVVVPYYNKPTAKGQYEYFKAVASETDKPVVLYNVPGRTGVNMTAETALKLAEIDNIVAIKEASGDFAQITSIIRNAPEDFAVLSGNDDDTLKLMQEGAAGVISVASNIAPELMVKLVESAASGDFYSAGQMHERLMPLFRNCFIESNPMPVKAGLAAMGFIENELRLPLVPCERSTYDIMAETVKALY